MDELGAVALTLKDLSAHSWSLSFCFPPNSFIPCPCIVTAFPDISLAVCTAGEVWPVP